MPSAFRKLRKASGRGLMIRARGERRWYLVYQEEKEQLRISWPVTGGNSSDSLMTAGGCFAGRDDFALCARRSSQKLHLQHKLGSCLKMTYFLKMIKDP